MAATAISSGYAESFMPKAPPTSGVTTRTLAIGSPSCVAKTSRIWLGT
ncbi:MAG TPA: hypothetical protein VGG11_00035 [Xanthobacteraceae bacterium]